MHIRRQFWLGIIALASTSVLRAQTTGSVSGRTLGENGDALPGVTVEATSPALQGTETAVTDGHGAYRLACLAPRSYQISACLSGLATGKNAVTGFLGATRVV